MSKIPNIGSIDNLSLDSGILIIQDDCFKYVTVAEFLKLFAESGGGSGGDTSNLVPYTGANKDVNIGAYYFETHQGFKKTGGTANQALTADGSTFDLDSKENVANKATDLSSPDNTKYPTTLAVVNETKKATITVELINQLTTNFYAPNALRINSTELISGSGTLTLKVNDVAYTLADLIPQGAKITAETTSQSVYNLISIYE